MRLAIEQLSKKQQGHDQNIELLFEYIDRLQEKQETQTPTERKQIGHKVGGNKNKFLQYQKQTESSSKQ